MLSSRSAWVAKERPSLTALNAASLTILASSAPEAPEAIRALRERLYAPEFSAVTAVDFSDLSGLTLSKEDLVVVMTRGHQSDFAVLRQVLPTPAGYVGCMGSRAKVALTRQRLLDAGISLARVDSLKSPIGLPIGAETPEEIAVSITAQLIAHRAGL